MMEETLKQRECFLVREESIRRIPKLIFAVSKACQRESSGVESVMAALPNAIEAKCNLCGFELSGVELLALADFASINEQSIMVKRLRAGRCARESCDSGHYSLSFYNVPQINWSEIFARSRPRENPQPKPEQPSPRLTPKRAIQWRAVMLNSGRIFAIIGFCLLAWVLWRLHTGGSIPILRQPEHFRVEPANEDHPPHNH
jgi:hypothetical protein